MNLYPYLIPSRNKEWGWNLQNPYVIFTSSPNGEWNKSNHPSAILHPFEEELEDKKMDEKFINRFFIDMLFNSPELDVGEDGEDFVGDMIDEDDQFEYQIDQNDQIYNPNENESEDD